jgi:hypothetical protein
MPQQQMPQQQMPQQMPGGFQLPQMQMPQQGAAGGGGFDATAILGLLASNPQIMQALRAAPVLGQGAPPAIEVAIPGEEMPVSIPLHHVVHTIAELAARSSIELAEADEANDESYLYNQAGQRLAEPGNLADRSAVVLHYFRLAGEAERFGESDEGGDESEGWGFEAGF